MNKISWKTLADFKRVTSSSLVEKEQIYTIEKIQKEEIIAENGRTSLVTLCYFLETNMPMVLNKTNMKTLELIFESEYIEDWTNQKINVFVKDGIKFGKDLVSGLRIREIVPEEIINCEDCGGIIKKTSKNSINSLISISNGKYSKKLCAKCLSDRNIKEKNETARLSS